MEKYGFEKEKDDQKEKKAAEAGTCPKCGAKLTEAGICPSCGSLPFEKKEPERRDEE